jgi:FRG domain
MIEITVNDWNHLNDLLFEGTWNLNIHRHRSSFAYRGVSDESYEIKNGLSRLGTPYPNMEANLLKQFQKYSHKHIVERDTIWHWLSIAEHHGLPTRLINWTYSPLVALHFATENLSLYDKDAAVWKLNYAQAHDLLQDKERKSLAKLGSKIFDVDNLSATIKSLEELDSLHAVDYDVAVFFEPPAIDDRIVNQFAYFSALSNPYMTMNEWFQRPKVATSVDITKIIIPHGLKLEIRDKLDQCNINERILFPGLDGLCSWLKRHYKPI